MVSAHRIAILPSTPAARRVSAAVALANPPPSSKKSTSCASFVGICFDLNNCARASLFNHSAWGCRSQRIRKRYLNAKGEDYIFLPQYLNRQTAAKIVERHFHILLPQEARIIFPCVTSGRLC